MATEKLSMKQAKSVLTSVEEIFVKCAKVIVERNDTFVEKIVKIWEDQNALDYMRKHKRTYEKYLEDLDDILKVFAETTKQIADAYAQADGIKERFDAKTTKIEGDISIAKVLKFFIDSPSGEDFGFKNPADGEENVYAEYNDFVSDCSKIINTTIHRLHSINAFGNLAIQNTLASVAGKVVDRLNYYIIVSTTAMEKEVGETARGYKSKKNKK